MLFHYSTFLLYQCQKFHYSAFFARLEDSYIKEIENFLNYIACLAYSSKEIPLKYSLLGLAHYFKAKQKLAEFQC